MADIDVVKKGSRTWVWVLMLVVLAVILWMVLGGGTADRVGLNIAPGGQPLYAAVLAPSILT
jgi:hypothetical protein